MKRGPTFSFVIPANAGIQQLKNAFGLINRLDSRLRGNDVLLGALS